MVASNPYSRLMALQRMGIVKDYEQIRSKTVAVVVRLGAVASPARPEGLNTPPISTGGRGWAALGAWLRRC